MRPHTLTGTHPVQRVGGRGGEEGGTTTVLTPPGPLATAQSWGGRQGRKAMVQVFPGGPEESSQGSHAGSSEKSG